ncbi:hypothetical protein BO82DRAFT_387499 [Aspergillus uvarum CBS 121591]|uniref:F-box domain-containing protein n=1 Tax=Aspergillus uvarum CBS 121591 TaxID=1448315 RepID=A0A319BUR5_9EURO|nr:hypothetical protein BO82DRAFT_387499 [Aspergillus uvarum CBS 121591]PYH76171.1 hypothetical protein BO82DRAFT_387499 [Aspergillus uvarum CBS 121591]
MTSSTRDSGESAPVEHSSRLMLLPGELRNLVYTHLFAATRLSFGERILSRLTFITVKPAPNSLAILRACRLTYEETTGLWLGQVILSFETVEGMLDKLSPLPPATQGLIQYGTGWQKLRFLAPDSDMLAFAKIDMFMADPYWRKPQPKIWNHMTAHCDGEASGVGKTLPDGCSQELFGVNADAELLREEEVENELLVMVCRGRGADIQSALSPPPGYDIREWAGTMTWSGIKRQCRFGASDDVDDDDGFLFEDPPEEFLIDSYVDVNKYVHFRIKYPDGTLS